MARDWRPRASLDCLRTRAAMLARVRQYFAETGALEVETPILSRTATPDPQLDSFVTEDGGALYLHTSPEFFMKRLLAAGSGSIYQIAKVFRRGEQGRRHAREFSMLEWYRVDMTYRELMDDVAQVIACALGPLRTLSASEHLSYAEAFKRYCGVDGVSEDVAAFRAAAARLGIAFDAHEADVDVWRDLLLTHAIEPHLGQGRLSFIFDYPASQAALARLRPGTPPVAERFEVYLDGIELANGFAELRDANEQRTRFEGQLAQRRARGLAPVPLDEEFLRAVTALPACSGVALGLDRLLLCGLGLEDIATTQAFKVR